MSTAWPTGSPQARAAQALTDAGLLVDPNLDGAQLGTPIVWRPELGEGTNTRPFSLVVRAVFEPDADIYTELGKALVALADYGAGTWLSWRATYATLPPEIEIACTTDVITGQSNGV